MAFFYKKTGDFVISLCLGVLLSGALIFAHETAGQVDGRSLPQPSLYAPAPTEELPQAPEPTHHVLAETAAAPLALDGQSLDQKIARMIAVALQLRSPASLTIQRAGSYGSYTEDDLVRVLEIARRNNENTRAATSDSVRNLSSSLTQGGSFTAPKLTNAEITTLTVSGDTRFNDALTLAQTTAPATTTDKLYNLAGDLYWAGSVIGGATTGQWTTDGTNIWRAEGSVGIGTSSPNTRLTVAIPTENNFVGDAINVVGQTLTGNGGAAMNFFNQNSETQGLRIGNQAHSSNVGNFSYVSTAGPDSFSLRLNAGINLSGNTGFLDLNRFGNHTALVRMGTTTIERSLHVNDNVGIGTTTPWRRLSVNGTVAFGGLTTAGASSDALCLTTAGEVVVNTGAQDCTVSSERFKHTIQALTLDEADGIASALAPVAFRYNDTDEHHLGLIAEEVAQVDERLIFREDDGRPRGVRYGDIVAVLLAAFQKQKAELASLAERVGETASATFDTLFARKIVVNLGEFDRIVARDEVRTPKVSADRLCLEDLCITRADLAAILESRAGQGSASPAPPAAPEPAPEPEAVTTATSTEPSDEDVTEPAETTSSDEATADEPSDDTSDPEDEPIDE